MPPKLLVFAGDEPKQLYRMRAPASGREALAHAEPGQVYVDRETGEEMDAGGDGPAPRPLGLRAAAHAGRTSAPAAAATS